MSIDDNTSENAPVIKSRTGNFLRGMFDKKAPVRNRTRSTPTSQQEFMQVVPEPITWDEGEETNWDDDFIEAPQPAFIAPVIGQSVFPPPPPPAAIPPKPPTESIEAAIPDLSAVPESLPDLAQPSIFETITDSNFPSPIATSSSPRSPVAKADEDTRSAAIEVSIPRPKNIKYKSKNPNAEPVSAASNKPSIAKNEAIDLDIQRPKNIRYKTNLPAQASWPERLLAPVKSLAAKISAPFDQTPKIYIEQVPADGKISAKKPWQLPSLDRENLRQVLMIAGALFLAMTVAWAVINFWPRAVAATPPAAVVVQPAEPLAKPPATQPVQPPISPEVALAEAAKTPAQTLASLYPAGLIADLELDNQQETATVIVGNLWFSLTPEQQQQTAQSLWQQARNYQMSRLEVRGTTDRLLARSPFVGTAAILVSQ